MKKRYIVFILLIFSIATQAQSSNALYRTMFAYADSLSINGKRGVLGNNIGDTLLRLDKVEPANFFMSTGYLLKSERYNDASVIYYIGYFRYRYYNAANPGYQASGDGALLASLHSIFQEPIGTFLKSDIDNFILLLEYSKKWLLEHDYDYFSKKNAPEKYNEQLEQLDKLINDLKNNKAKYQAEWPIELAKLKKAIGID